jgi:hypothetical protein
MKKLNIINIIQNLLPPSKRKPIMVAFLKVLTAPLQALNNWIADVYYPDVTRRTRWNSQVILFSKLLNDLHNGGNYSNRIYITNGESELEYNYFYNQSENEPISMYNADENLPLYNYNWIEYEVPYDFVVNYPVALEAKVKQIESSVRKYKVVGTNYIMKSY